MDNFDHYTMRQGTSRYIFTGKSKKCDTAGAYHAATYSGHTLPHLCGLELIVEGSVGVLESSVTMEQRVGIRVEGDRFIEVVEDKLVVVAVINLAPDVIVMSAYASVEADDLQVKTGTPVVVVPGSDTTLDAAAYETIRIMGQLYGTTRDAGRRRCSR